MAPTSRQPTRRQLLALTLGLGAGGLLQACALPGGQPSGPASTPGSPTGTAGPSSPSPSSPSPSPSGPSSPSPSPSGPSPSGPSSSGPSTSTAPSSGPATTTPAGPGAENRVLNIVAHPDDDLLFLSPDLLTDLRSGAAVRTVYTTAGDAGRTAPYWQGRIRGVQSAYAQMLGVADTWVTVDPGLARVAAYALAAAPQVSLAFLLLPDGGPGHGYPRTGRSSLEQLWLGRQRTIEAVDGTAGYTRRSLTVALARLVDEHGADTVRTQNYTGRFGDGDHGDHLATAYLVRDAVRLTDLAPHLAGYHDYETESMRANVAGAALAAKRAAFFAYAQHDVDVCGSVSACGTDKFGAWLTRQYRVSG